MYSQTVKYYKQLTFEKKRSQKNIYINSHSRQDKVVKKSTCEGPELNWSFSLYDV